MNYLSKEDQKKIDVLQKKADNLLTWIGNNIMHPDYTLKVRERNCLLYSIARIKKAADPYKPKVVDTANIIIHPMKQY